MVWFNVDDGFWSHPKVLELPSEAIALWVRAGSYCAKHLTDGQVKPGALRILGGDRDSATELVLAGLWTWDETTGCWWFHDWSKYQRTKDQVEADRAATKERVAKHRAKRASNAVTDGVSTPAQSSPIQAKDFYSPSESQSSSTRARVSTDAIPISAMTKKLAGQQGIRDLRRIVDGAHRFLGLELDADQAYRVCLHLLGKAKEHPRDATAYVLTCFEGSTEEVRDFIFKEVA